MKAVRIDASAIVDEASLHAEFDKTMGFPDYYGNNWNAWIDCMSCLTEPAGYMSTVHLEPNEELRLELVNGEGLRGRCPSVFSDLIECVEFVNGRYAERGEGSWITVALVESAG